MFSFFKKNKSKNIIIHCSEDELRINDLPITFPINYNTLTKIFGEPSELGRTKKTRSYLNCWSNYGLYCNYSSSNNILSLSFIISKNHKLELSPKQLFKGELFVDNEQIDINTLSKMEFSNYVVRKMTYQGETKPYAIYFGLNLNSKKEIIPNKYNIKPITNAIEFEDFGFKLAIIQELMYTKKLLTPAFDLNEFAESYDKRKINLESEGYEPIAEVTQYFKDLPISKKLASEVTEIYQDGGNDIYLNLLHFGGGDEEYWDIKTVGDANKFQNLKKAILCYAKADVVDQLNAMDIEAEWI